MWSDSLLEWLESHLIDCSLTADRDGREVNLGDWHACGLHRGQNGVVLPIIVSLEYTDVAIKLIQLQMRFCKLPLQPKCNHGIRSSAVVAI